MTHPMVVFYEAHTALATEIFEMQKYIIPFAHAHRRPRVAGR